jgi:beta-galactosidase
VAYITATVVDEHGVPVPGASDAVTFKISAPGVIAAVDNGDIASHELFQTNVRHAYQGRCVAIVRASAPGRITLSASADGLSAGTLSIEGAR